MRVLGGFAAALRAWLRPILICAAIGGACGLAWGLADEPSYEATATVIVLDRGKAAEQLGNGVIGGDDPRAAERLVALARSSDVAKLAAASLGGDVAGADVLALTDFSVSAGSGTLAIHSVAGFADYAAAAANAYSGAIVQQAAALEKRRLKRAKKRFEEELAAVDPASEEGVKLQKRLDAVATLMDEGNPLRPGAPATLPSSPLSNRSAPLWALLGLAAGAALAIGALGAAELRRRPVRTSRQLRELAGAEPLALLGTRESVAPVRPAVLGLDPLLADRGTGIAVALGLDRGGGALALTVSSAMPAEGRTTVALGLAASAARLGRGVLLIEADMRRPALAGLLGIDPGPGLSEYLAGGASPGEVINPITVAGRNGDGEPTFVCVTAGAGGDSPAAMFSGTRFGALLGQVRRVYDLVVFDGPALLPAPEAILLCEATDETLLVARAGVTRRAELRRALGQLSGVSLAGTVLTGAAHAGPGVRRLSRDGGIRFAGGSGRR